MTVTNTPYERWWRDLLDNHWRVIDQRQGERIAVDRLRRVNERLREQLRRVTRQREALRWSLYRIADWTLPISDIVRQFAICCFANFREAPLWSLNRRRIHNGLLRKYPNLIPRQDDET